MERSRWWCHHNVHYLEVLEGSGGDKLPGIFPFRLYQLQNQYVAAYFSILYLRYRAIIVTNEMVAVPKSRFMAIGLLGAIGVTVWMSIGGLMPNYVPLNMVLLFIQNGRRWKETKRKIRRKSRESEDENESVVHLDLFPLQDSTPIHYKPRQQPPELPTNCSAFL